MRTPAMPVVHGIPMRPMKSSATTSPMPVVRILMIQKAAVASGTLDNRGRPPVTVPGVARAVDMGGSSRPGSGAGGLDRDVVGRRGGALDRWAGWGSEEAVGPGEEGGD